MVLKFAPWPYFWPYRLRHSVYFLALLCLIAIPSGLMYKKTLVKESGSNRLAFFGQVLLIFETRGGTLIRWLSSIIEDLCKSRNVIFKFIQVRRFTHALITCCLTLAACWNGGWGCSAEDPSNNINNFSVTITPWKRG